MIFRFSNSMLRALPVAIVASLLLSAPIFAIDTEIEQAVVDGDWQKVAQFYESKDLGDDPVAAKLYAVACFVTNCGEMLLTSLMQTPDESVQNDFGIWCQAMREKHSESAHVSFVNGMANLAPEFIDSALESFDRAIEFDEQSALALAGKGFAQLMYRNYLMLAGENFSKSVALDSNLALGHLGSGMVHLYLGKYEKAIAEFDQTLAIVSNSLDAKMCKGVALVQLSRLGEVESLFDDILGEKGLELYKLYAARGDLLSARGLHRSAIWDYSTALAHFNPDLEEWIKKRPERFILGSGDGGLAEYKVEHKRNEHQVGPYINTLVGRGACFRELLVFDSAISDFSHSLELLKHRRKVNKRLGATIVKPNFNPRIPFIARILLQRGMTYYEMADYRKGRSDFSKVIDDAPESPYAYYWKALCLKESGKKKKSKKAFKQYLERATESDTALSAKAEAYIAEIENK